MLQSRGEIGNTLYKAGSKILNCSLWGLFQSITPDVNYKVGTALCKSRLCPNCQRVLAAKRRANFLDWFELNRQALRPYFFYHMVLTVRHSSAEGVRTGLYTPDLLKYFAQLRGTSDTLSGAEQRKRSGAWKDFVAGGSYSVEIKQGADNSPHIHIHCLLLGKKQLWNAAKPSKFMQYIKPLWNEITGDSTGVFLDPVHYIDPVTKERHNCHLGSNLYIAEAVAECEKYTIKADAQDLTAYSDAFLTDLLTFRNRYYSRFGCLSSNDKASKQFQKMEMLCTDYKDLEQLERLEVARLFNPETGEIVAKEDTQYTARPFRYVRAKPAIQIPAPLAELLPVGEGPVAVLDDAGAVVGSSARQLALGGGVYFELLPAPAGLVLWFPEHEKQRAAIALSRSIRNDYDSGLELPSSNS